MIETISCLAGIPIAVMVGWGLGISTTALIRWLFREPKP